MAVNVLLSYAFHNKTDLAKVRSRLVCGRMMIDSGAFTAFTTGKTISLQEYAEYLQHWEGHWDHAVTLDVIGDPAESRKQTQKLHAMGINVMPVFTRGDTIAEFDAMVKECGYVCVGGLVGLPPALVERRATLLQRRAEENGGGIHALGVGAIPTLSRAKPYSADASNVSGAFRFGTILFFDKGKVINVPVSDKAGLRKYREPLLAHGIDVAQLASTGRMPSGTTGRPELMRGMSLSYAAADEWLKKRAKVPVPHGTTDTPGTHLYSSIVGGFLLDPATQLDRDLHNNFAPRIWREHGSQHQCHPQHQAGQPVAA
jgi:hypothetical protein